MNMFNPDIELRGVEFGRRESMMIRGVAILAMIMHHCITLAKGIGPVDTAFAGAMKVCVGLFTFLAGYGWWCSSNKTVRAGMRRAVRLTLEFWTLLAIVFIPLYIIGGGELTVRQVVMNLFGISESLHWFSWYVYFYIFAMAVMPLCHKIINRIGILKGSLALFAASYIAFLGIAFINRYEPIRSTQLGFAGVSCMAWFPTLLSGYMAGRVALFRRIGRGAGSIGLWISAAVLTIAVMMYRTSFLYVRFDPLFVPVIIAALLLLLQSTGIVGRVAGGVLVKLGEAAMLMWFLHGLFVITYCREFTLPLLEPVEGSWPLLCLWIAVMSYILARIFKPITGTVAKLAMRDHVRQTA